MPWLWTTVATVNSTFGWSTYQIVILITKKKTEFYNDNSPIYEKTDELGNQNLWILIKGWGKILPDSKALI